MLPLIAGELTLINDGVWRVLAPNPSLMTGPGTNTYLVRGADGLLVIDPGPANEAHTKALLAASDNIGVPISHVLVTHTHRDHSPGAQQLLSAVPSIQLAGPTVPNDGLQDESWQPHTLLEDNSVLPLFDGSQLRVISTPGHVGNHLCFFYEKHGLLFTGDHLINGSTVVIAPPSGSMSAYLRSLEKLQSETIHAIAPGHGNLIEQPQEYIAHTIAHRLKREAKVLAALEAKQGLSLQQLVVKAYDDTPAMLHGLATYSLWAHLIKLEEEGLAKQDEQEQWWLIS